MKLYQTIDGTMIGFYRERGGEVEAIMYRDVYEMRPVKKTREEQVWIESTFVSKSFYLPGHWEDVPWERPGRWERRAVRIPAHLEEKLVEIPGYYEMRLITEPGHYERFMVWHPEYWVTRYREVPGHYEIQSIWVPEYYVTRYYWREAHPARGLEAAWIPYQHLIPAGYKDQRVWVETYTESYQELMPAEERETRVWVEGETLLKPYWVDTTWEYQMVMVPEAWGTKTIWIEPISEIRRTWIPAKYVDVSTGERGHWETKKVEYTETVEVWIGYEPVYSYVDEMMVTLFEVLELKEGAGPGPDYEDAIVIRNRLTGEEQTTTARFVGLATRIADNEYVVP